MFIRNRGNTGCTRLSLYCPGIIRTFNPDHKLLNMPKQSKREMSDKLRSDWETMVPQDPSFKWNRGIYQVIIKIAFFWSSSYEGAITLGTY